MLTLNKFAKKKEEAEYPLSFFLPNQQSHLTEHRMNFKITKWCLPMKEVETPVACLWCSTPPAPDFAAAVFLLWIALCFNSHFSWLFACSTAAPLLLLILLLLCSSCELRCASTRTSPGCLLVLLQHLSCSCIGSACCCFWDRETERQRDRETERQRDRETETAI